jgi:hypothetical protein
MHTLAQPQELVLGRYMLRIFRITSHTRSLMMVTRSVPERVSFDHLTWLMSQEDFNEFGHHDSFKSHMIAYIEVM